MAVVHQVHIHDSGYMTARIPLQHSLPYISSCKLKLAEKKLLICRDGYVGMVLGCYNRIVSASWTSTIFLMPA